MQAAIECMKSATRFNAAWNGVGSDLFGFMDSFPVVLAILIASNTSVEAYFSMLEWEKNKVHTNLIDSSLEGILQASQMSELSQMRWNFSLTHRCTHSVPHTINKLKTFIIFPLAMRFLVAATISESCITVLGFRLYHVDQHPHVLYLRSGSIFSVLLHEK